ncbi:hypothetical protein [Bdellovibrio svalbardensis]|uniref:DUF4340 domain-containing protein n=1 Tax=Bdellovibrio svalbardensis TaxID=2972972 RepID=A0ABT6DMR3_9BACT|nr:hypothetical protein [Bdellovibrio svalbardensis]MDG0818068.1 hypothetical protein [Bdellovibrio svalbardensis]
MLYKIIGAFIIAAAATIAFLTLKDEGGLNIKKKLTQKGESACVQLTPAEQLVKLIDDDFKTLAQSQQLPQQWSSIATVEYRNGSELARAILGKAKPGIQRVQNGTSYLEIEVMDLPDESNPGIILQASLFDIKSKNKIFEIGRTYTMNDLNHQASAEKPVKENEAAKKENSKAPNTQTPGHSDKDKQPQPTPDKRNPPATSSQ